MIRKSGYTLRLSVFAFLVAGQVALAEHYTVPLFVWATTADAQQGVLRILNGTEESGTVEIYAVDDAGVRVGPATFTLNAWAAVEFDAIDLASGNAAKGLTSGIGSRSGDSRVVIDTELQIESLAYVRAADGTLSAMHDTVRAMTVDGQGGYSFEVPIFNPSTEVTQVSRVRLINPGDTAAAVTIQALDDTGVVATGGSVQLTLPAGGAQTLSSQQLEAGDTGLTGQLGAGVGKWRLSVSADQAIQVVNIVAASAGYLNNLSTTAVPGAAPADHAAFNDRFVGVAIEYRTDSGVFTLNAMTGDRFSETGESDGVTTTYTGSYTYEGIGSDAGRLTLTYDDGDVCAANLYFGSLTAGWFASRCTGSDYPADGYWIGGSWSAEDADDVSPPVSTGTATDGECYVGLLVQIGESCTYPGTSDEFTVNDRGRGTFLSFLAGIRIRINNQTINGRVYDLLAVHQGDGVWRFDRVAGSTEAPTGGGMVNTGAMDDDNDGVSNANDAFPQDPDESVDTDGDGTGNNADTDDDNDGASDTDDAFPQDPGESVDTDGDGIGNNADTDDDNDGVSDIDDPCPLDRDNACSVAGIIPDANLRAAIEAALGKVSGAPITEAEMERLTRLFEHGAGISDLSGLEYATNLTRLGLEGNDITDVSALAGLTNLTELSLFSNAITDISALAGLTRLTRLYLGLNNVTDISALAGLTNLTVLSLVGNSVADISLLSGLTNLTELSLSDTNIPDLAALSDLSNLTHLRLIATNTADLSPLAGLTNLTSVVLSHNKIVDISPLAGLTNLTDLNFWENQIEDISALAGLTNLTRLGLGLNNITEISALAGLTKLTELALNDNAITDISPLAGLTNLTWLNLAFNSVTDISALAGLTNLMELNLAGNHITDISALSGLTNLQNPDLRANPLNDLPKGDFDIELVLLDDFTESQQRVLQYVARRWMAVISEDLPDYQLAEGWSGTCGGQSFEISSGERIDDLRIYVSTFNDGSAVGYGGPSLLREDTHLPVLGCMAFDLSHANLLITGLHEIGHVLGFASEVWDEFGFYQNPPNGDTHFTGPLVIAAFDDAGGRDYTSAKVPLQTGESHWRIPVLEGELMAPYGGGTLSAITVQSLADLGYGVDVTQADPYTLPGPAAAQASATQAEVIPAIGEDDRSSGRLASPTQTEPKLWCGFDGEREPIYVVDPLGRIIRTIGN